MKEDFLKRLEIYFPGREQEFLAKLKLPASRAFIINTDKADKEEVLSQIPFSYQQSKLNPLAYKHNNDNVGRTVVYEAGLIYPQDEESSLPVSFIDHRNVKLVLDLCCAPGGKAIDYLNLNKECLLIGNDVSYKRATVLSSNFERLGLDRTIVTNKRCEDFVKLLYESCDLVILDAPCSGEGMMRKYPELFEEYDVNKVYEMAAIQKELLEVAYRCLKRGGQLLYSTCTYALEEDEDQIVDFLNSHEDMKLVPLGPAFASKIDGTIKLSLLNDTEGQFMALLKKDGEIKDIHYRLLKPIKEKAVDDFIKDNLDLEDYYLYKDGDRFYLSLMPLPDLGYNVLRYGIFAGTLINKRFEPSHCLYRANGLRKHFRYVLELNDEQLKQYLAGLQIDDSRAKNHYYLLCYHGHSLGFGKGVNGVIKNKFPKGLRRMI